MSPIQSFAYGIPYVILMFLILFFARYDKREKTRKFATYGVSVVLLLFFGLRGFVQTDWQLYYWMFEKCPPIWSGQFPDEERIEYGFLLYMQLFKSIIPNYFAWVFCNTLIDVVIFTYVFRRFSTSLVWSWVFFIVFTGLVVEINLYRNSKAIGLFLLSLPYIQKREFWKFLGLWLAAVLFHFSAVIFFPLYFFLSRNWGKAWPLVLFIFVNIMFFFRAFPTSFLLGFVTGYDSSFVEKALDYMAMSRAEEGITFGYVERTLMFILVYVLYNKLRKQRESNLMFCNSYYIFYTLWYIFSDVPVFVERFPVLFGYSYWILGPNMMALAKGKLRRTINVAVILFAALKIFLTTDHILYEYDNVLWGVKPYAERYKDISRYQNSLRRK